MDHFEGKTAVVTGAASGIGRALADRFAAAKMRVVLADVEEKPLREAEESLLERGVEAIAVRTDLPDTNLNDEPAKPDAVVSGTAYRGVVSRGDRIVWSCPHIHFTEHSARACAVGHLQRSERDGPGNVSAS